MEYEMKEQKVLRLLMQTIFKLQLVDGLDVLFYYSGFRLSEYTINYSVYQSVKTDLNNSYDE